MTLPDSGQAGANSAWGESSNYADYLDGIKRAAWVRDGLVGRPKQFCTKQINDAFDHLAEIMKRWDD